MVGLALLAWPAAVYGYRSGAPLRSTGTIDGGRDCSSCHNSFGGANSDSRGVIAIENLQPYVPGVTQNLRVTLSHPTASSWGFQLTARFVTGDGTLKAGSFAAGSGDSQVACDDGSQAGSKGPCQLSQYEWLEHSLAPRTANGVGYSFPFQWTPPADEKGDITFYVAMVAGDGNSNELNDRVYTATFRIPLGTAGCPMTLRPVPSRVVNAGSHLAPFAGNSMVEIYGSNFQASSRFRTVGAGDLRNGAFPKELSCVAVEIAGVRVPITYVQQDQINVQAPALPAGAGSATVTVIANPDRPNELRSLPASFTTQDPAPAFFTFGTSQSIAAQFAGVADVVADPAVVPGARPAKPGEWVTLYGTGFGATSPSVTAGTVATGAAGLTRPFTVSIGGTALAASDIYYGGLSPQSISGLYQFNVKVPLAVADGSAPVVITMDGQSTQVGAFIPIKK